MYLCICNCLQETGQCATVYVLVTVYRKRDDVPQKMIWSYMVQLRARVKFMAISQNHGCDKQDSLAGLSCKSGPFLRFVAPAVVRFSQAFHNKPPFVHRALHG